MTPLAFLQGDWGSFQALFNGLDKFASISQDVKSFWPSLVFAKDSILRDRPSESFSLNVNSLLQAQLYPKTSADRPNPQLLETY